MRFLLCFINKPIFYIYLKLAKLIAFALDFLLKICYYCSIENILSLGLWQSAISKEYVKKQVARRLKEVIYNGEIESK